MTSPKNCNKKKKKEEEDNNNQPTEIIIIKRVTGTITDHVGGLYILFDQPIDGRDIVGIGCDKADKFKFKKGDKVRFDLQEMVIQKGKRLGDGWSSVFRAINIIKLVTL